MPGLAITENYPTTHKVSRYFLTYLFLSPLINWKKENEGGQLETKTEGLVSKKIEQLPLANVVSNHTLKSC